MRGRITWVVAGALAVIGAVAAVDALRGDPEAEPAAPATSARESFAAGLRGVLYYTDENCELRALRFPSLEPAEAPAWSDCRFGDDFVDPPWAGNTASESEGSIYVSVDGPTASFRGSAPASRPDGTLTFVRDGALRTLLLDPDCLRLDEPVQFVEDEVIDRCSRVLLRSVYLRSLAVHHPNAPGDLSELRSVTVKEHAWLDDERLVLLLAFDVRRVGPFELVAVLEGTRVIDWVAVFNGLLSDLRVSPRGHYFAVITDDPQEVRLFNRDGDVLPIPPLPSLTGAHAVAWSPSSRWMAIATRADVYVFRTGAPYTRVRRLGIRAGDIAWRAS
jgi:hypothetical protein